MKLHELKALAEYIDLLLGEAHEIRTSKGFGDKPFPSKDPSARDTCWYSQGFAAGMEHSLLALTNILGYVKIDDWGTATSVSSNNVIKLSSMDDIKKAYEDIGRKPEYNIKRPEK